MNYLVQQAVKNKQSGKKLSEKEITSVIHSYHSQSGKEDPAWMRDFLLAVKAIGLGIEETVYLTEAMAQTGKRIDWNGTKVANKIKIDVPSTGGTGNKTPLIVPPILAAAGAIVPKMSTRGSVAGTIDILESIGYKAEIPTEEFIKNVETYGLSNICQTADLAPVDKKLMLLRRETDTMRQGSLVISSILCKKIATGCNRLVIDVKAGKESRFGNYKETLDGSLMFVEVGKRLGIKVVCVVTDNDRPQGKYIGNSLSLVEVIEVLSGSGPEDLREICMEISAIGLVLADVAGNLTEARKMVNEIISSGKAARKFVEQLIAHSADLDKIQNPSLLQDAKYKTPVLSQMDGFIEEINVSDIDKAAKFLITDGKKIIHYTAGIVLMKQERDHIEKGEILAMIHSQNEQIVDAVKGILVKGIRFSSQKPPFKPYILALVDESGINDQTDTRNQV